MNYLTSKPNDSFVGPGNNFDGKNKPSLILKMGLAELVLHLTILLLMV